MKSTTKLLTWNQVKLRIKERSSDIISCQSRQGYKFLAFPAPTCVQNERIFQMILMMYVCQQSVPRPPYHPRAADCLCCTWHTAASRERVESRESSPNIYWISGIEALLILSSSEVKKYQQQHREVDYLLCTSLELKFKPYISLFICCNVSMSLPHW